VLPAADAIVNPNQPGCTFPSKNIAGVGVMFYVLMALRAVLREEGWFETREIPNLAQWLDIVALGTVADVVPLDVVNRTLVQQGLLRIRAGQASAGIAALIRVAQRECEYISATDLGFALGPRLNAAGRLDDMSIGIACLLCDDPARATELASTLHQLNLERRDIEGDMQIQANLIVSALQFQDAALPRGLALYDPSWHQGVVGILASRIKEQYHRPVICMTDADETTLKGSARSVAGVHIRDILDAVATQHPGMIKKFGGHAMAAGLTIDKTQLKDFQASFAAEVAKHLSEEACVGELITDGALSADELTIDTAKCLQAAGPWGQLFPEPVFDGQFKVISSRVLSDKHIKYVLQSEGQRTCDAILFNARDLSMKDASLLQAAYTLDINRYQGQERLQLLLRDVQQGSGS
jgi:single-stranded-DNA-specific exonuclease